MGFLTGPFSWLFSIFPRIWVRLKAVWLIAYHVRVALLIALITAFLLLSVDQTKEVMVSVNRGLFFIVAFNVSALYLAFQCWYWSRYIYLKGYYAAPDSRFQRVLRSAMPLLTAAVVLVSSSIAIWEAAEPELIQQRQEFAQQKTQRAIDAGDLSSTFSEFPMVGETPLPIGGWFLAAFTAVFVAYIVLLYIPYSIFGRRINVSFFNGFARIPPGIVTGVSFLIPLILVAWSLLDSVSMGFRLGAATILLLTLSSFAAWGTMIESFAIRKGVPVIGPLILFAVLFSFSNSNHGLGIAGYSPYNVCNQNFLRSSETCRDKTDVLAGLPNPIYKEMQDYNRRSWRYQYPARNQLSIEKALDRWAMANGLSYNEENVDAPTPTYSDEDYVNLVVVATAGGGLRAASWTATILGALQDQSPDFTNSVFAISGVSGGSLGAATFAAAIKNDNQPCTLSTGENPIQSTSVEKCTRRVLSHDFLAPLLASFFYGDMLQRFFPIDLWPDRARSIERAWERAWTNVYQSSDAMAQFHEPMMELYRKNDHWVPNLIINGTHLESGKRIITSNLDINEDVFVDAIDFYNHFECPTPLSTAVHNSARFPFISPPGDMQSCRKYRQIEDCITTELSFQKIGGIREEALQAMVAQCWYNYFQGTTAGFVGCAVPFAGLGKSMPQCFAENVGGNIPRAVSCLDKPVGQKFSCMRETWEKKERLFQSKEMRKMMREREGHIVDGGYFENFGAETLRELLDELERLIATDEYGRQRYDRPVRIVVVQISNEVDFMPEAFDKNQPPILPDRSGGLNEVLSPIKGLLNSRVGRGMMAVKNLERWVDIRQSQGEGSNRYEYYLFNLEGRSVSKRRAQEAAHPLQRPYYIDWADPALGWTLSRASEQGMCQQLRLQRENSESYVGMLSHFGAKPDLSTRTTAKFCGGLPTIKQAEPLDASGY